MTELNLQNIITPYQCLLNMRKQLNNKLEYMNKYTFRYSDVDREYVMKYIKAYDQAIQDVK